MKNKKILNVLLVEDDDLARLGFVSLFGDLANLKSVATRLDAIALLEQETFDMAFIDLDLQEKLEGLKILEETSRKNIYSIILTGHEEEELIEMAYRKNCRDYLCKPFNRDALQLVFSRFHLLNKKSLVQKYFLDRYVTHDLELLDSLSVVTDALVSQRPIFIGGPIGCGKTMIARLIHEVSFDNGGDFINLNCSDFPENLLESELFGYRKGAFSGADKDYKGKLELADGGTLFLDEVANMSLSLQKKILTAVEEKQFYPLGSEKLVKSNFKLITATWEDLRALVAEGKFREDLYYRLEGVSIHLKALRERPEDIPLLIKHFQKIGHRRIFLSADAIEQMKRYPWPGNVRELKTNIELLMAKRHGIIEVKDLPLHIVNHEADKKDSCHLANMDITAGQLEYISNTGLAEFITKIENEAVLHFYERSGKKVRATIEKLKISNSMFYRILKRCGNEVCDE